MKYFLNTLLFTSIVLFTLGCIDEHEKKESLKETVRREIAQERQAPGLHIAQSKKPNSHEVTD